MCRGSLMAAEYDGLPDLAKKGVQAFAATVETDSFANLGFLGMYARESPVRCLSFGVGVQSLLFR